MDCSLPGSSVHGIFQARILEWVTILFSRESSWPRDKTQVSRIAGRFFTIWDTREAPFSWKNNSKTKNKHSKTCFGWLWISVRSPHRKVGLRKHIFQLIHSAIYIHRKLNRTIWGSWAWKPFWPPFLIGDRLHSGLHDLPWVPRGRSEPFLIWERGDTVMREGQPGNNSAALGQGPGSF